MTIVGRERSWGAKDRRAQKPISLAITMKMRRQRGRFFDQPLFTFLALWSIFDVFIFPDWTWVEIDFIEIFNDCTSFFYWFVESERPFQRIKDEFWDGQNNWKYLHEKHVSNQIRFFTRTSYPADDFLVLKARWLNTVTVFANVTLWNLPYCSELNKNFENLGKLWK